MRSREEITEAIEDLRHEESDYWKGYTKALRWVLHGDSSETFEKAKGMEARR